MGGISIISLDGGSDFFNLNILTNLSLLKEVRKAEKIESEKPAFGRWIWNKLKDVGEVICISRIKGNKISWHEQTVEVYFKEYILGFEVEHLWAKATFSDLIKNLTEEEWDWAVMDPEVIVKFKPEVILDFDPVEYPRPVWLIQECHVQNQKTNTQPIQDKASFQGQKCPSGDNARLRSLEKKQNEDSEAEEQLPVELTQDKASFQGQNVLLAIMPDYGHWRNRQICQKEINLTLLLFETRSLGARWAPTLGARNAALDSEKLKEITQK